MKYPEDALPDHWKRWIAARAETVSAGRHRRLGVQDFPRASVQLQFEDGSTATFRYAFAVADVARGELAVFTEHCGYHVFPLAGTECEPVPASVTTS